MRELRQNASKYLRRVAAGESFTVTDRGTPIGMLAPLPHGGVYERLVASGEIVPGRGRALPEPLPAVPGFSASAELQRLRDEERY